MGRLENRQKENRRMNNDRRRIIDADFKGPERRKSMERRAGKERRNSI